ncbi:putative reverse transcriptase domain-containing protein [Tanacetum coccineum]
METSIIPISSDSFEESVGSHVPRVILFDVIPALIPMIHVEVPIVPADPLVELEVGAVSITSPAGVLDLVDYSSSDSDPLEDSLPSAPELPLVLPFLCFDDSEADSESDPAETRKLLTVRKRVGPFPTRRLAWGHVSHCLSDRHSSPDFTSDLSSSGSSSDSSSDTFSGSPSDSLLAYPSVMTRRYSEAFRRWRSASLSTLYPPTTSESSPDSSSERSLDSSLLSARPYRKRCRSPTTSVPSSTPVLRSIAPNLADLLPPHKRFRDLYSPEDSREEHMEIGTTDAEAVADLGNGDGVGVDIIDGVEIAASDIREDKEEFEAEASAGGTMEIAIDQLITGGISESTRRDAPDLEGTLYDIVHYMSEVPLDRITEFETTQRQLETGQLMASGERAGLTDRIRRLGLENLREEFCQIYRDRDDARRRLRRLELFVESCLGFRPYHRRSFRISSCVMSCVLYMTIIRSEMNPEAIEELIAQRVAEALANYETTRAANALEAENQSQNGNDGDSGNDGNRNGRNGNGNHGDRGNNRNGNPNENGRGAMPVAHLYTYQDFVKCQPLNFKGTERVVDSALTWWNSHKRTVAVDAVFAITWRDLMKLMTKVYCLKNEIQKMENELWNLTVKNNDLTDYTQRFQELTLLCTRMVPEEEDRIERYVGGLPDNIQGNVMDAEPTRLQDAIWLAKSLMDQKLKGYAIRSADNKREFEINQRDNRT